MKMQNPLARARGLGSAKQGTHHWWLQRISALALIPLTLWFVFSLVFCIASNDYAETVAWLQQPLNTTLMLLFIIAMFTHAVAGLQVVIEDYINGKALKLILLIASKFLAYLAGLIAILSILKIFLGLSL